MALLLACLVFEGCTKREFHLSEDTALAGTLDPMFAVPLVHGTWMFGEVLDAIEIPATLETDALGEITAVFPFEAFESFLCFLATKAISDMLARNGILCKA